MRNRRKLPSPAEVVRAELAEARRVGLSFEQAWTYRAWPALMERTQSTGADARREWVVAIEATRSEWAAAYEGRDTHFSLAVAGRDLFAHGVADYLTDPWAVAAA